METTLELELTKTTIELCNYIKDVKSFSDHDESYDITDVISTVCEKYDVEPTQDIINIISSIWNKILV